MKKIILTILAMTFAFATLAQPRTVGLRLSSTGIEASYQHTVGVRSFIEGNAGVDRLNDPGFKLTATYNYILGSPNFSRKGEWNIYAGGGITAGYVSDRVTKYSGKWDDMGFMGGFAFQLGIEYNFDIPLQLSLDLRPVLGWHSDSGYTDKEGNHYAGHTEIYNYGLYGFIPSLSVRYIF